MARACEGCIGLLLDSIQLDLRRSPERAATGAQPVLQADHHPQDQGIAAVLLAFVNMPKPSPFVSVRVSATRSMPALRGRLNFRQFRKIHKTYFPEYKRARKKTDLCDHCVSYTKKILPRARDFMQRVQKDMEEVCPNYWHPVLRRAKFKSLFTSLDTSSSLTLVQDVLGTLHERCFANLRAASPRPESIRHVEGALLTEAKLHSQIVAAYEWHQAAAQVEQSNMRNLVENLGPNRAYCHFDFMEKLPIPISGSETSDQFHGSQRKTLSVFTMYAVQRNAAGQKTVLAVVLVSEIIELSALFGSLCVLECLKHIENVGSLEELILGFDAGTHFRSYENLYYFLHKLAAEKKQKCRVNFLVEKHGKSMCDSEVFSPIRRWLDEFLLNAEAFCDTEDAVVKVLLQYAKKEMKQNPGGTKFDIHIFAPPKPRKTWALNFDEDLITRSYSWEAAKRKCPVSSADLKLLVQLLD